MYCCNHWDDDNMMMMVSIVNIGKSAFLMVHQPQSYRKEGLDLLSVLSSL